MGPDRLDARAIIEQLKDDPRFKRFERAQAGQPPRALQPVGRPTTRIYRDEPIVMTGSQMAAFLPPAYHRARDVARTPCGEQMAAAQLFVEQGRLLADVEDDVPYTVQFERYFPTYQMMSDRQLRCYVSWRTRVRRGEVAQAPTSFMFVYCYELINGIGAASPLDAFCELRRFWGAYRQEEPLLDRYAVRWLWDLAAYHDLDRALVAGDPDLSQDILYDEALAKVLGRGEASEEELFSSLDALSSYHVLKSRFYKEHPEDLRAVTLAVLGRLEPYYAKNRTRGLYEGLFGERATLPHRMFEAAVFHEESPHLDARYRFDALQRYTCTGGRWQRTFYPDVRSGASRLGAILKAVDVQMRERYGFGHPLKAPKTPKYLAQFIDKEIDARFAWHKAHEVRQIQIDRSKLQGIRSTAALTREALLVDEERADAPVASAAQVVGERPLGSVPPLPQAPAQVPAESPAASPSSVDLSAAPCGLTELELRFVLRLLDGQPTDDLLSGALTAELLVDAVNEKLFDLLGDTAVEFVGAQPSIVEDYWDDVKGAVCP